MRQAFYYKMRQFYYKMRQLSQIATILLQNATVITKCDVYYKLRQYIEHVSSSSFKTFSNALKSNIQSWLIKNKAFIKLNFIQLNFVIRFKILNYNGEYKTKGIMKKLIKSLKGIIKI